MLIGIILYWLTIITALICAYIFTFRLYDNNGQKIKHPLWLCLLMFIISFFPIYGLIVNVLILFFTPSKNTNIGGFFKCLFKNF